MMGSRAAAWRGSCFAAAAEAPPATAPAPLSAPKEAHGFELQRQQWIREYDSHMLIYKHKKTGEGRVGMHDFCSGWTSKLIDRQVQLLIM